MIKKMKKIIMCIVMMLSMITVANADEMNTNAFHLTVNTNALNKTLDTNNDQAEAVSTVMNLFDMQTATVAIEDNDSVRAKMMDNAVNENVKLMRSILNSNQMKTYLTLLNTTLVNRGLK